MYIIVHETNNSDKWWDELCDGRGDTLYFNSYTDAYAYAMDSNLKAFDVQEVYNEYVKHPDNPCQLV